MILFKKVTELRNYLDAQHKKGKSIGFVPTMGALHEGHVSLVKATVSACDITVCSIFINPTQFNDPKDFNKYPVTLDKDILLLEEAGCDIVFIPSVKEIYPGGTEARKKYPLDYLDTIMEGKFRPGHFQGVCMVVEKLLEIVQPDHLFLGQKDYQQSMVIKQLIHFMGKEGKIEIHINPTFREKDGLAMSSRNRRLSDLEREKAPAIFQALQHINQNITTQPIATLKKNAIKLLEDAGFKVDYVEIAQASDLTLLKEWNGKEKIIALIAAFLGEVRLIDNMVLN